MKNGFLSFLVCSAALMLAGCFPRPPRAVPASPAEISESVKASTAPLTLVHVWATWCPPCRLEFPDVVKVHDTYSEQGLSLILISADDPQEIDEVEAFLVQQRSPIDSLITTELSPAFIETLSASWGGALPASFFFVDGRLVREWAGARSFEEYRSVIDELLKK